MELYEIATKLVVNGGWSIIPVDRKTKKPILAWKEYQTRYPEIEELQGWFDGKTPNDLSLGVVTGKLSNLIIIDSDDGSEFPFGLDSDLKSKTGRGYHLFYKYHEGVRNTVKIKGVNVDIRGEGGYAIIPPSIHISGVKYQWVKKGKPSDVPNLILNGQDEQRPHFVWKDAFKATTGSRNDRLFKGACSLFAKGFKSDEVFEFMKAINKTFEPPLPEAEVQKSLESAAKHERIGGEVQAATPRKISSLTDKWLEMKEEEKSAPSTGFVGLDKIIGGFIPRHLYTLTAETNSGKTQLAVNFAVALAQAKKKVAFIALEPDINIITGIKACLADTSYAKAPVDVTTDYIDIFLQEDIPTLEILEATLAKFIKEYSLVIVDHIGYFGKSEDKYAAQGEMLHRLATLAKTSKSAILIIAHPKKRNSEGAMNMNDIAGSAAFKQDSTEVLILNRKRLNPDDEFDKRMDSIGYLVVEKKKVTNISELDYIMLKFDSKSVKIQELKHPDNTSLIEDKIEL